ncbi:MAG: nickel pincer cofactor biosynthesis protein LarB [Pirellulaceae bacterium]
MNRQQFEQAAKQFRAGRITLADFANQFTTAKQPTGEFPSVGEPAGPYSTEPSSETLDPNSLEQAGFPPVIDAPGKSINVLRNLVQEQIQANKPVLVTRIEDAAGRLLCEQFPPGIYNSAGRTFRFERSPRTPRGNVVIVTASSTDAPIAEEAEETLKWLGVGSTMISDVEAAGPRRLAELATSFHNQDAAIVVTGSDGSLPSLVAAYLLAPVIAVPTSFGFGANLGGLSALLSMLNSAAANVAVVNVDGGFKAAYLAGLISLKCAGKRK